MTSAATTALTYNSYINQISTLAVVNTTTVAGVVQGVDAAFNTIIPQMLSYSELRIQRDLDLLQLETSNSTYAFTAGNNQLAISVNDFVTLQTISYVSGTATLPLLPVSKQFLQNVYNDSSSLGAPIYYAVYGGDLATAGNTTQYVMVGPYPDQSYPVLLTGTIRMPTLNGFATTALAGTSTTWISTYLPDLLIMSSMIYISGFQRNFSKASDDPSMAVSYESQYQALLAGAKGENYRARLEAAAWSSSSQPPAATPTR
jgi:hypothetical protein